MQQRLRSEQPYDHDQCTRFAVSTRTIGYHPVCSRWCSNACTRKFIHHPSLRGFPMRSLSVNTSICTSPLPEVYLHLGTIIGMIFIGLVCDRMGRKVALVSTTLVIAIGATLGTAARGAHGSPSGLFWFLTFARGITGIVRAVDTV